VTRNIAEYTRGCSRGQLVILSSSEKYREPGLFLLSVGARTDMEFRGYAAVRVVLTVASDCGRA
jgi:hypothetical protein